MIQSIVAREVVMCEWVGFTMNYVNVFEEVTPATASIETGIESTDI